MKNILKIFKDDLSTLKTNVIALIVVIGITVIPSLYAWFNIEASWDPYSKTKNIKVAIANMDAGYKGDLVPIDVNIGEKISSSLREHAKLHWVFTHEKAALDGVKSGEYYAAIVIPKTFSSNMMSLFTDDIRHPEIRYYYNEKKNAIAPKVTDKGASAIQAEINQVFISTLSDTLLSSLKMAGNAGASLNANTFSDSVLDKLEGMSQKLTSSAETLDAFEKLSTAGNDILNLSSAFYQDAPEEALLPSLKATRKDLTGLNGTLSSAGETLDASLDHIDTLYEGLQSSSDAALSGLSEDNQKVVNVLKNQAKTVSAITDDYKVLITALTQIKEQHPQLTLMNKNIDLMIADLRHTSELHDRLSAALNDAASHLSATSSDTAEDITKIHTLINDSRSNIRSAKTSYTSTVKDHLNTLQGSLLSTNDALIQLLGDVKKDREGLKKSQDTAKVPLKQISASLNSSSEILRETAKHIDVFCQKIQNARDSGDSVELAKLLRGDSTGLGKFISAPVKLETRKLYPVKNYGSAMAPFYSTLAIWVGGIVLVAIMKVDTEEKYPQMKHREKYFGRYILFLILGLLQTTLIILGDLYFLEITCPHPMRLLLAGWASSLVYVNIIYTLTISFGDVGKALSVILLVMQVAGTGGTFPIECAPPLFRSLYPLLPFTHSMNAMRECIGGCYDHYYVLSLIKLLLFLVPSLLLGLVLRRPVIRLNQLITEKLEDTKIM